MYIWIFGTYFAHNYVNMEITNFLILNIGHALHDSDWNFHNIISPFTRIYYVTKGEGYVSIGEQTFRLRPGYMYMIPAFTEHSDFCEGIFNHFYVHIYEDVKNGESIIENYQFPFEIKGSGVEKNMFELLCRKNPGLALKYPDPRIYDNDVSLIEQVRFNRSRTLNERMESMGAVLLFLSLFIANASKKYSSKDPRIKLALKFINENTDRAITVDETARQACLSTNHFIRQFKEEIGITPAQFIIEKKMMRAKLALATESTPVNEIAYSLGYDDPSYFTRLFKRHVGKSPKQFRQDFND